MDPYNTADALNPRPQAPAATAPLNPYAAPTARLAELRSSEELTRASRLSRLGAQLLDGLIVGVPIGIAVAVSIPGMQAMQAGQRGLSTGATVLFGLLGLAVIAFSIYQLVLLHRTGQTLGKKLVGIRIVRTDGGRASLRRIFFLRYCGIALLGAIPLIGPFISLADYLFIFGGEMRCIHDYIADTIVVDA
jgi:uncharacterized RDD family membrane protein YckC